MKLRAVRDAAAVTTARALIACALVWSSVAHAQTAAPANSAQALQLIERQEDRLNADREQPAEQTGRSAEYRSEIQQGLREAMARVDANGGPATPNAPRADTAPAASRTDEALRLNQPTQRPPQQMATARMSPTPMFEGQEGASGASATRNRAAYAALPDDNRAPMRAGRLAIEPSFEFSRSSSAQFAFRGAEFVDAIQGGPATVDDAERDLASISFTVRYAPSDRLEVEARVPFVHRDDQLAAVQHYDLGASDLGDVELSARYQLTRGREGAPMVFAGARVKSTTGTGPFGVERDGTGVATEAPTGSGFWAAQGNLSVLYPTERGVVFGTVNYTYNAPGGVNQTYGAVAIGDVDLGDSAGANFGMAFDLSSRFSASVGYSHTSVSRTEVEVNGANEKTPELQIGSAQFGLGYRASEHLTISVGIDIGITEDAPDFRLSFRTPYRW